MSSPPITNYLESLNPNSQLFIDFQLDLKNKLSEATATWLLKLLFQLKSDNKLSPTDICQYLNTHINELDDKMNSILQECIKLRLNDEIVEELIRKSTTEYITYMQIRRSVIIQNVKEKFEKEFGS
ncbi:predicted protein [Candida tropicalis MYA-3404]|uniref:Uncharacterized protein n=1 Tax=Candida tropicalis (strain ATCC MYA-3404 / T1) TaxID=294747 RepID=C5MIZ3_CANTT|nr:predicted protein [Candida tropicalis MYA-3404]EER30252.1 predicted protein [Candida tropicalis MYA-3404]KAG4404206.1 hypothetical protein JTP64_001173 [Candida tropicalis]